MRERMSRRPRGLQRSAWALPLACAGLLASCGSEIDAADPSDASATPSDAAERADDAAVMADAAFVDTSCEWANPKPPQSGSVLWPTPLLATGEATLGGHGHDDGLGKVGHCSGEPQVGQPFYRLIAAGFETDADIGGDGMQGDDALGVGFWRDAANFTGYGESGGRVHVYVEVLDEAGNVLNVDSTPDLRIVREILDGPTDSLQMTSKPANEFQTNFAMIGGGARYAVSIEGASDKAINMRLPVNHHVCYMLIFQRENH